MNKRLLIGITGSAGVGKTTLAQQAQIHYGLQRDSFADTLKRMLETMGIPRKYIYDQEWKNRTIPPYGKTGRKMMQSLGTDWGRKMVSENIWVYAMHQRLLNKHTTPIIIDDVRFDNEARTIKDLGGHIIRLVRPGFPEEHPWFIRAIKWLQGDRRHLSEKPIDPTLVDMTIWSEDFGSCWKTFGDFMGVVGT